MFKKVLSICLSIIIVLGVVAAFCSCGTEKKEETHNENHQNKKFHKKHFHKKKHFHGNRQGNRNEEN